MKKTLIAALAVGSLLAFSPALLAADTNTTPADTAKPAGGPPGGGPGMRGRGPSIEQLTTDLSLTDEQKPKVQAILDDQRTKMGELRNETDQTVRRTKMRALREEVNTKMKDVLTADQFDKYQKMQRNFGPNGGGGGGNKPPATPPQQ